MNTQHTTARRTEALDRIERDANYILRQMERVLYAAEDARETGEFNHKMNLPTQMIESLEIWVSDANIAHATT